MNVTNLDVSIALEIRRRHSLTGMSWTKTCHIPARRASPSIKAMPTLQVDVLMF